MLVWDPSRDATGTPAGVPVGIPGLRTIAEPYDLSMVDQSLEDEMNKVTTVVGVVVAIAAVLASPDFAALIPASVTNIALLVGAVAAAIGKSLTNGTMGSKSVTAIGVVLAVLGVFASPEFSNLIAAKWASFASLLGALIAATGASLFPAPKAE
jgi:hypothetical protein